MKRFFEKNGLWVLFVAVVAAVTLCVVNFFSTDSSPLTNLLNTVLNPFRSGVSAVQDWVADKGTYFRDLQTLTAENAALRKQVEDLERQLRQAERDGEENVRLRTLLELKQQHRDYTLAAAKVTERGSVNWESSLSLNAGEKDGITAGNCVITESGALVGVVSDCGYNWCRVLTVLDTETSVGGLVFRTQETCVAKGDFHWMQKGRLLASYIDPSSEMMVGDLVVTSGLGGYYPAGLSVGKVESLSPDESGLSLSAVLRPSADLDTLTEVFVVTSFDVTE